MNRKSFWTLVSLLVGMILSVSAASALSADRDTEDQKTTNATKIEQRDDWVLNLDRLETDSGLKRTGKMTGKTSALPTQAAPQAMARKASEQLGLAVGGAKDVHNFRENIAAGYMPLVTDITAEGLFYDYEFQTSDQTHCEQLFCPVYDSWVTPDPFSGQDEYFLSVGLQSGMRESDFQPAPLNLVVVLDISGSMSSPFQEYYYDRFGHRIQGREQDEQVKQKMEVAKESLIALTRELRPSDRLGIVVFNNQGLVAKPLNLVARTDMQAIRGHIQEDLRPLGGTNMSAGMEAGTGLFEGVQGKGRENRIIFMTDAMPNLGATSQNKLAQLFEDNAGNGIHTTFVGMGVDFNTELVEAVTKVRGANIYSVHNAQEFKEKLSDGLAYMVSPLVFNLRLTLQVEGFAIDKVFGSPEAEEATGEMLYVNTLFPSPTSKKGTRGGIIVVKLQPTGGEQEMSLQVSYEDRQGERHTDTKHVLFEKSGPSKALRKGVLLSRYVNVLKSWIVHDRGIQDSQRQSKPLPERFNPDSLEQSGIPIHMPEYALGRWERQSQPLHVSSEYKKIFQIFSRHFVRQAQEIGDPKLQQEEEILHTLIDWDSPANSSKGKQDDWRYKEHNQSQ